jgi:hypothetical protein
MTTWTPSELEAIGSARELKISSLRADGTLRKPVTIWIARVDSSLYVRSVRGAEGGWYRGSQQRHEGHIKAGGVSKDVQLTAADSGLDSDIDAAYKEKYGYPSSAVDHITSSQARATTMRLVPVEEPAHS